VSLLLCQAPPAGPGQRSMGGMDNPAMDDFAHMNLIDDLLTE
jgi:hypothetical protein